MSRWLMGSAALAIFAATGSGAALAQGKSNISGCSTFSSFTYDVATNTLNVVNCGGVAPIPVPTEGTFSWSSPTATIDANATSPLVVRVNRNGVGGSNAGFYVVDYTVSASASMTGNWWFNGARTGGRFAFADGIGFVDLGFMPSGVAGTVTVTLTGVTEGTGMTIGTSTLTINVTTSGVVTPPPPPPPPGCGTSANYNNTFTVVGQKFTYSLKPGETAASAFTAKSNNMAELSTSDTVNTPPGADHEIVVSKCPGDFTNAAPTCKLKSLYKGGVVRTTSIGFPDYYCQVNAGETYYMNVRQVKYDNSGVNSCDYSSCEVKVQIQAY